VGHHQLGDCGVLSRVPIWIPNDPWSSHRNRSADGSSGHFVAPLSHPINRGESISFPLNRVIKGWTEGMQLVGQGGMIELEIPPDLAYGDRGDP
jgi:hypothetical protein